MSTSEYPVVIIGTGPVGALQAIFLAKRNFKVELYEKQEDVRLNPGLLKGRTINLALSHRGREALKAIGCEKNVLEITVPMDARYVHLKTGKISIQPYGKKGQAILSIERQKLNEFLLTTAETYPNVKVHFKHKLIKSDFNSNTHTFSGPNGEKIEVKYNFTFGCDGTHSTVRTQFMRWNKLDFSQKYIEHSYKELRMPATEKGDYPLPPNYVHIWPRHDFVMLAQANRDKTFTLTMFMPVRIFDKIKTNDDVMAFFKEHFPDTIEKIGKDKLIEDFFNNPVGTRPFVNIKCSPYYFDSRVMIMGDAAHAVVPFYAQGLNTGMEDCLIFDEMMEECNNDLHLAAQKFSEQRWKDCHAIADLSMYNYLELSSYITSKMFLIQGFIVKCLHHFFPSKFIPLYSMVAFTRIPIHEVVKRNEWQKKIINRSFMIILMLGLLGVLAAALY